MALPFPSAMAAAQSLDLMPAAARADVGAGRLALTRALTFSVSGADSPRLRAAIGRTLRGWEERTGLLFQRTPSGAYAFQDAGSPAPATVAIECTRAGEPVPMLGEDESYELAITGTRVRLKAATTVGALRGLETLLQLPQSDANGWFLPAVTIHDQPRFPWRGLMIDVCRHWEPIDVIKRNLDGMALVKLNVLHLHLTEDQGFRIESKRFPRLQEFGSDGHFFTQDQIREIIAYAADRGIRVVPEFDMPGHATSWVVGFPELASAPGPYVIERRWGVFNPVLDPTNEKTYELLDGFLGEMAALFPDPYLHIGGDENNGKQWNANPRIQAFIRDHHLGDNAGLHAYFNRRVRDILQKYGKKLVGWDEILHPDLPQDSVVQSWRGAKGLAEAASRGYATILSNGYYIDLCRPAAEHYRNDPIPPNTPLSPAEQQRVLGGEATMWGEWVTPETIDSRIWPRTAAIAERLWSPRAVDDVPDMYRRLALVSRRLEEAGLHHEANRPAMIRRFVGDNADAATEQDVAQLVDLVEPVKGYQRGRQQPGTTQFTPLTGLADCARPESDVARRFADAVSAMLFTPAGNPAAATVVREQIVDWRRLAGRLNGEMDRTSPPARAQIGPMVRALLIAGEVAADAVDKMAQIKALPAAWQTDALARLDRDAQSHGGVELPIVPAVRRLVAAAALQSDRGKLPPDAWRARVEAAANPPAATKPAHD